MLTSSLPRSRLTRLLSLSTHIESHERRAVALAFLCNFMMMGSYYILRPVRDTTATVFGADQLQYLFTGTFIGTLIASPIYTWLASRLTLKRLLPGVFWFWVLNILLFQALFRLAPESRAIAAAYYWWFSIANLFMISVFWSLMVDLFSSRQATRLFALIAAGGSIGSIAGPIVTRFAVHSLGLGGLLLLAAAGFLLVIVLVHLLMREKDRLRVVDKEAQHSTLDHQLAGNPFDGFGELLKSSISRNQAAFMLLMTWVNTVGYFFQTDAIANAFSAIESRAVAIADIALVVNIGSAIVLTFGLGRFVTRFGVTAGLLLNPLIMVVAFVALALSPTLLMVQALQVVRQVSQYAIARPSREICFTVVEQRSRYKTKNVIDTVFYRLGDVSSAWILTAIRAAGLRLAGSIGAGIGFSVLWGGVALMLGRRYESLRAQRAARDAADAALAGEVGTGAVAGKLKGLPQ
jgi:ATP:ADP antiporter, AAA family